MILPEQNSLEIMVICYKMKYNQINKSEFGDMVMYKISEAFHKQYADMYDKFVRIYLKDGSMRIGLFNDEFYEDTSILVSCEVIKITDIEKMELFEEQP